MKTRGSAVICFSVVTVLYVAGFVLTLLAGERLALSSLVVVTLFAFPLVGVLIAFRRPDNRIAWLCLAIGLAWGLEQALWGAAFFGFANPGSLPRPELWAVVADPLWVPGIFIIPTYLLMLFPDGHLPSPRWRWLVWLTTFLLPVMYIANLFQPETSGYGRPAIANPLAIEGGINWEIVYLFEFVCVGASVAALVIRYRRETGVERQQLKWLVTAAAIAALAFMPAILLEERFGENFPLAAGLLFALIPIAIGIAIVRYRLYEIDRLISRTVTYVVVIGVLALVYAGVVFVLRDLLPMEGGVPVAGSTLVVAALFNPLRRRVQGWVDRRFNRSSYDSQKVSDEFAGSLRDEVDPGRIAEGWVGVVSETMQPELVEVWLKKGGS